jgi:hypothetical protein
MRLPKRLATVAVIGAVALLSPAADAAGGPARAQLVTAAHASPGMPEASDTLSAWDVVGRNGHATTTATASSTCDGCHAFASTVHVVRTTGGGGPVADNVAAAWSTCTGCGARAVSVQVVLAPRATSVVAANRALAVNAVCDACDTSAIAVQYVLVGGRTSELSDAARQILDQLAADLGVDTGPGRPGRARATGLADDEHVRATGAALQRAVGADKVTVRIARDGR